ncbi:hypothetical protein [Phenylobacterium immobile]|uniref:hypothetical protein n=1 Tax=Phenylobacterium immobile TaxID=21 RepID=UPI000B85B215|nr:hypothetical protein [Phenylobacterium immobile]
MKSIAAAAAALSCLYAQSAFAQAAKPAVAATRPGPEAQLIEGYFQTLKSGYPADATAKLFIQTPLMQKNPAATDKLTNSAATYINFYGSITHWSFANEKVFAPGVKRQTWVLYTVGAPVFFTFDLYVSATGVGVLNVNINDKYESAF